MVRLGGLRSNLRKAFDERPKVVHTPAGCYPLLQFSVVGQQRYQVAGKKRHLREAQRGIHRVIELLQLAHTRPQESPSVQHEPYGLAALHLIELCDQLPPPRRCAPRDVAEFVAGAVLSQAIEFPSLPTLALEPLFKFYLAATNQVDAHSLGLS